MIQVTLSNGQAWTVRKLLAKAASNPKLAKDDGGGKYLVFGLSMSPHKIGGGNVCPHATPGCIAGCLSEGGMAYLGNVRAGRQSKHVAWLVSRDAFLDMLRREIRSAIRIAKKHGKTAAIRLNVFSDIPWEKFGIPQEFPEVVFYDYTKNPHRGVGWVLPNYHLTFSKSEENGEQCRAVLSSTNPGNVAAVFATKNPRKWGEGELPKQFMGFNVIDGDTSDLRFLDPPGVVVALRAKGKSRKDKTGFVVRG